MTFLKNYKFICLPLVLAFFAFLSLGFTELTYSGFTLQTPQGKVAPTEFPFFKQSNESGVYVLKGTITASSMSATRLRVVPDDELISIQMNGKNVDLSKIPAHAKKDYNIGFAYDFSEYLNVGANTVTIVYKDFGGLGGIVFSQDEKDPKTSAVLLILVGFLFWLCFEILQKTKLRTSFKVIFLVALALRAFYFSVTPQNLRDHDLGDHHYYVKYMSENWAPPELDAAVGGAFFHPPLFYYTGAVVFKVAKWIAPLNTVLGYRSLQALATLYSMGFVLFGLLIFELLFQRYRKSLYVSPADIFEKETWRTMWKGDAIAWIIGGLLALWPVGIIHSPRIGNDPLLYFTFVASLFFIMRWFYFEAKKDLIIASVIAGLSILTKANGAILIAVLFMLALYKAYTQSKWKHYSKLGIIPSLILLVSLGITFAPGIILKLEGKREKLYIDDIGGLSTANLVGNTASNYLWFDTKIFITHPFTSPFDDRLGRQYFWNYLGKTGLFGEFDYHQPLCRNTAVIISLLAFFMFIYTLLGLYNMKKRDFQNLLPLILAFLFLWGGVTYMRMTFPANIDFRYILPILIPFCAFFGLSILTFERLGKTKIVAIGFILTALFVLNSILFILGLAS